MFNDNATILMSDQLQADSVLQSMHLLLYWALSYRSPKQYRLRSDLYCVEWDVKP